MLRNILTTGGTGLVGFHMVKALLNEENINKIVILEHSNNAMHTLRWNELLEENGNSLTRLVFTPGDILDGYLVYGILVKYEITHILHFAAQAIVHKANKHTYDTLSTNVFGTYNILEAAQQYGKLDWLLIMSTDKIYGEGQNKDVSYNYQPTDMYSISKITVSMMIDYYRNKYKLPIYEPRCCNLYGFDQQLSRLIPSTIVHCLNGEKPIVYRNLFGNTGIRQYLYVEDAIQHFLSRMDLKVVSTENIGSKDIYSSLEVVLKILEYFPEFNNEPEFMVADFKEIQEQSLHFENEQLTSFEEGIARTIAEYRKYYD